MFFRFYIFFNLVGAPSVLLVGAKDVTRVRLAFIIIIMFVYQKLVIVQGCVGLHK